MVLGYYGHQLLVFHLVSLSISRRKAHELSGFAFPPKKVQHQSPKDLLGVHQSRLACSIKAGDNFITTTLPLGETPTDQWQYYCEDIDKTLEYLVSPAPESFHVIHSKISQMNKLDEARESRRYLMDMAALADYLLKPNVSIQVYREKNNTDSQKDRIKWKVIPGCSDGSIISYPDGCISTDKEGGKKQLYHTYSTLQLSQMALDLATTCRNEPDFLDNVHDIVRQVEVSIVFN